MRRGLPAILVVAVCGAACGATGAQGAHAQRPRAAGAPRCYDLPGAPRYSLRIGADGAAYWIEHVVTYDYDGNSRAGDRLVRLDRATGATSILATDVAAPFRLLHDGRILYKQAGETGAIVLLVPAGGTRTLTPPDLDVSHFELTPDQRTIVFAGRSTAGHAIYEVSLEGGAARWLADADEVYAADPTSAIVARERSVMRVPLAGGAATTIATLTSSQPYDVIAGYLVHYDDSHFWARPLAGGEGDDRLLVGPPGGWQLTGAPDHVFLTRRDGERGVAIRIEGATTRAVPTVLGGLSLDGAEPVDGEILALVAQDTDHDGSPDDARDEVDVCLLPATGEVALPVRHVPRRIAAAEPAIAKLAAAAHATWDVIEDAPGPMTLQLHVAGHGGDDLAALRTTVRALAAPALAAIGDPELRVDLLYGDGRRATSYTDEAQHRRVAAAGIGDVVIGDPSDHDVEVTHASITRDDRQQIVCSGEVVNHTARALHATVECIGGAAAQSFAITPDPLVPGGHGLFAGAYPDAAGGDLSMQVRDGDQPLLAFDGAAAAQRATLYGAAAQAYDRSQLTLWSWHLDDGAITADVDPPGGFADFSNAAQEVAATAAFDALAAPLRVAVGAPASAPVTLRIHLGDGQIMEYDGQLHAPRQP